MGKGKEDVEERGKIKKLERRREEREAGFEELERNDRERQRKEKWERIRESRCNR